MIFRHLVILTAALLVLPMTAQAETVVLETTSSTTPPGYKETTVLKGYKVTTTHRAGSAPVAGETNDKETVFIPADQLDAVPPAAGMIGSPKIDYTFEKSYKGSLQMND